MLNPNEAIVPKYSTLLILLSVVTIILLVTTFGPMMPGYDIFVKYIGIPFSRNMSKRLFTPVFVGGVVIILLLERVFPVTPKQKTFTANLFQDAFYFLLFIFLNATFLNFYIRFLKKGYAAHYNFLTIDFIQKLPVLVRFIIGVLFADFVGWFHHLIRHRIPFLWEFHKIHHSQKEMNLFTDLRYHFIEYVFTTTITVPLILIFVGTGWEGTIGIYSVAAVWFTQMYHARIRSNLGILRYIFVTPQSHRIHHSRESRHHDSNYGVVFSLWDRLFGTQYNGYDEYPETGIEDESFPHVSSMKFSNLLWTFLQQHFYPVFTIFSKFKRMPQINATAGNEMPQL